MAEATFELGTVLAGKYRLESRLGEGGMGTVYRAEHLVLRAPVAVKVIEREVSEGDVALARFMREAQAAASLRSPHVVQILDYGTDQGRPFMVMELLEGETLASRIQRLGQLTPGETYRVISHVARAIARAHEAGIVHRDLKPDNVFLVHNHGDEVAKVLDFGVAKVETTALGGGSHTRTGSLLGTPYYMSPEQAQGNKEIDHRSDLWALGVIAFECLTGKRPFSSDGLGDLVLQICIRDIPVPSDYASVPVGFDAWFSKATEREVDQRFQSARDLTEALYEALGLVRDPAGSAPESVWSTAPSLAQRPAQEAKQSATEFEAPLPPNVHSTTERDERPLSIRARNEPTLDSSRGETSLSSWDVVPHRDLTPGRGGAALAPSVALDSIPPAPRAGFGRVLFVAFLALAAGGALVFGLERAGVELPRALRSVNGTAKKTPPSAKKKPSAREQGPAADARVKKTPDSGGAARPLGSASKGELPTDGAGGGASTPSALSTADLPAPEAPTEEGSEQSLDALEREAAERTGVTLPSEGEAKPPSDGPRPEVPDGLTPAPAPPSPAP